VSPCHRRLRALENSGAISGYRVQLDAHALGLTFEALVIVTMRGTAKEAAGKLTGDDSTKNEGKLDQAKSSLKDAGEKVKDAFKN